MANISVVTAGKMSVMEPIDQATGVAAETIAAGAPVRLDTSLGTYANGNGTTAPEARVIGIALRSVIAGEALTILKRGLLDGFDLSGLAYDAAVYVSDTDARLADAAGTVTLIVGRVVPGHAQSLGVAPDKLLRVAL
jgi:hypothetical protein